MTINQKIIAGLGAGIIFGTAAGLLIAPKTGEETRNLVAARVGNLKRKATLYLGNLSRQKVNGREADADKEEVASE